MAPARRGPLFGIRLFGLGSGIDVAYPSRSRVLLDRILEVGSVVSEYPPGVPARPFRFPARNRIVACPTVSRTVGSRSGDLNTDALETTSHSSWVVQGQPGVDGLVIPGAA